MLLASMCHAMHFSARALKKCFLWRWYCGKKQIEMWFSVVCTLINNENASSLFSPKFFSYCFCMLSGFAKVFERKLWRVQVAPLHSAARVLSSPSLQLSTNLDKDFFRHLWYCGKKQIECGLAWSVLLSTTSTRHHSGQNVVDSRGASWFHKILITVMTRTRCR